MNEISKNKILGSRAQRARGKNQRDNSNELRDKREKKDQLQITREITSKTMRIMGGLQWCTGLVPCTRESKLLGTNPCALETPNLAESAEDDNKSNALDRGCERLEQANSQKSIEQKSTKFRVVTYTDQNEGGDLHQQA